MSDSCKISVIMPVLNEATVLNSALPKLIHDQCFKEVIVVDGGSTDSTITIVEKFIADHPDLGLQLLHSNVGRARQMNAGAAVAKSPILLFLHADSRLPTHTVPAICATLNRHNWGFFRIRIDSPQLLLRVASQMMCWRSALTSIATGDQALFIKTALFQRLGGFATIPLMEDIELCHRLKGTGRPACVLRPVQTSARRWQSHGMVRTILLMWSLRFAYWRGVDPATLSRRYHHAR